MTGQVKLGFLLAVAALFGCSDELGFGEAKRDAEERHCAGPDEKFVDDQLCAADAGASADAGATAATGSWDADGGTVRHGVGFIPMYRYVYVPHGYYGGLGSSAAGFMGATTPGSGRAAAQVARGGFGGTAAAHAAGGGHAASAGA